MRYSQAFPKTSRDFPKDEVSINAKLLIKGGFIDKLMSGSFTLLPLGFRVVQKINDIIREELNKTGAQEISMPLLHPKEIWNETGRWESAKEIMYQLEKDEKEFGLSFTHEEIIVDLLRKHPISPKDFPIKLYQFSTKFRHELRAKSGILRGREFLMKDLYSAHLTEEDMYDYYNQVIEAYKKIFKRLGLETKVVESSGGVFTDKHSHEFQVLSDVGEDTIYYCSNCDFAQNEEIFKGKEEGVCPKCKKGSIQTSKSIEVGNIFPLGTMYAEKMGAFYTDAEGKRQPLWLASYGIGSTRILGTLAEMYHDDKGLVWPKNVAPYQVHLITIENSQLTIHKKGNEIYQKLQKAGFEALYDDREVAAGEKFADADLIGIPVRLVISEKTADKIEWKERENDKAELLSLEEVLKGLE